MSKITIEGHPICSFNFYDLPSMNTLTNAHRFKRANITKAFRNEGMGLAEQFMKSRPKHLRDQFAVKRAFVLGKVFFPGPKLRDIYNVSLKAVCDGFTDAGIWQDDEWSVVPVSIMTWAGFYESALVQGKGKRKRKVTKTVLEVHELDELIINGVSQTLPVGGREIIETRGFWDIKIRQTKNIWDITI